MAMEQLAVTFHFLPFDFRSLGTIFQWPKNVDQAYRRKVDLEEKREEKKKM